MRAGEGGPRGDTHGLTGLQITLQTRPDFGASRVGPNLQVWKPQILKSIGPESADIVGLPVVGGEPT